ncbi:hypothetical protein BDW02DRAFT_415990 [Decorospora gaudefroyi]|uniref:Uncharacterized protein n=1 Tax=Decorospora gaudefroyi TaxID=184978 RepID=A0A6A5K7L7_9PLEO|nr:hypothetical protein BDW02DRAFT_415990 [Decorospora gaudefroyi]
MTKLVLAHTSHSITLCIVLYNVIYEKIRYFLWSRPKKRQFFCTSSHCARSMLCATHQQRIVLNLGSILCQYIASRVRKHPCIQNRMATSSHFIPHRKDAMTVRLYEAP